MKINKSYTTKNTNNSIRIEENTILWKNYLKIPPIYTILNMYTL